jgi:signal transduction histidine kinase
MAAMIALRTPESVVTESATPLGFGSASHEPDPAVRQLAASLAHNVNNALLGVIGSLELALRDAEPGGALCGRLQGSLACALRAADTVRQIVTFAFHTADNGPSVPLSLRQVVGQAARQLHNQGEGQNLLIRLEGQSASLVRASAPLLHIVLAQVLANARDAMPTGGVLLLRVWDESEQCCLSITDTGPGFSGEARARLFEPFFTTKGGGHLGLGLVLCRDLIESQNGRIDVSSVPGHGATVILRLPAVERA